MNRRLSAAFRLVSVTVLGLAFALGALQTVQPVLAGGGTCATKHCSPNTHCCYGCTGSVFCVRNGVPCPECAPQ